MPRKQQGWITFQSSHEEREILERYCQQSQRTKTEILRELVRSLQSCSPPASPPPLPQGNEFPVMKVSARNVFKGLVKQIEFGGVNAEVTLEIAPGVELVSTITKASAHRMELQEGKAVYAVIKSNNVILAEA